MEMVQKAKRAQYKETQTLRHVQDLGPYTMCIIRMMDEDALWPKD